MSCSKNTSSDAEVGDILSNNRISSNLKEKPLSPVLTGGLSNRKFLIDRRLRHKKSSRVKLTDRFKESEKEESLVITPINIPLPISFNDSLSASQTKTLIDHLDKLEELDNRRKNIYKTFSRENEKSDNFRKPKSTTPIKINKIENCETSKSVNSNNCERSVLKITPVSQKNLSTGFITAKGKSICISETDIKKHSKLFEDIIYPTQSYGEGRHNKHTFLSKLDSSKQSNFKANTNLRSNDSNLKTYNLNSLKSDKVPQLVQSSHLKNSFTHSNSDINSSEKAIIQGKTFFSEEEFGDIKFHNENFCGFKKASLQTFVSANVRNDLNTTKDKLSLTQAICDSGISNTQMINAFDNILHSMEENKQDNFRGFTKDDTKESFAKLLNMESIVENNHSIKFSRKRKRSIHSADSYNCSREECKSESTIFPAKKRVQNYENILNNVESKDFSSASGKSIAISKKYMKDAQTIFSDIDFSIRQEKLIPKMAGFSKINEDINIGSFISFQKASGKSIKISENSLRKAKNIFDQLDVEIPTEELKNGSEIPKLTSTHNRTDILKQKHIDSCTGYMQNVKDYCEEKFVKNFSTNQNPVAYSNNIEENLTVGFSKASGKEKISESAINKAKNIFDNLSMDNSHRNVDQTLVEQTSTTSFIDNTKNEYNTHANSYKNSSVKNANLSKKFSVSEEMSLTETTPVSLRKPVSSSLGTKSSKRKLGMSHFRPLQISDNKLDKVKLLFDEDFSGISPIKPKQGTTYTSTPIKQNDYLMSVKSDCPRPKNSFSNFVDAAGITPIKKNVENVQTEIPFNTDTSMLCISPTKGDLIVELETERKKLENRLQVLIGRETLGREAQQRLKIGKSADDKKPRKGLLYRTKTTSKRYSLITFVDNRKPGEITANIRLPINPNNAENLHFTKQTFTSILTEDGAVIIPNSKDMVGLSEIKNAFEVMPGVEPRLIPKGWIRNHYKWIVWKLVSYENMFPNYFEGCLSIENIVQQLKYRYDREIDRAERSALRKICEKDDAPQKRIILFVSDIKVLDTKKYELELCDGWYALRTIVDDPLRHQIIKGKIEIGTKLLISGAELVNCDGCHPLEVTNLVHLKINCNSTRRAIWHAKLGYQRNPNPFPIQLHSVYPLGGTIPAVKVCIGRVYPLKYMERLESCSVWRNRKAEEIASQKWENERSRKVEQIEHEVRKKFKSSVNAITECHSLDSDISNIKCPKTLYSILEKSNDPECLQQNLSNSQKEAIVTYQSNLSMKKQQEIAAEVSTGVSKLGLTKRDVVAVLKLLVIDIIGDSDRPFSFFIWRPTEVHLQSLKEGKLYTIQNILPRPNGDLNSTAKTTFKHESTSNDKCIKYKRRLMSLAELVTSTSIPVFNEFDVVGIVVQTKIESHSQEVWMTDNAGRLLLISVYEGPSTCSLLDNLKRGQPTTVCNLIYRGLKKDIVQASANHFTIFSSYSRHKHLQEGLDTFKKEMVKDMQNLLNDCDNKIEVFRIITDISSFSGDFDAMDEDTFTAGASLHH